MRQIDNLHKCKLQFCYPQSQKHALRCWVWGKFSIQHQSLAFEVSAPPSVSGQILKGNWHKKKWTRFSLKNHGRWQPGSPRYLRTNRGTYRQFDRIKNWWKFMVKNFVIWSRLWAWTFTKLIFFLFDNIFRASVLSEVQTSRNSQLPTSKNLLVLGKLFS